MPKAEPRQRNDWERQPRESTQSYAAFKAYVDAGAKRSLMLVAYQLRVSNALLSAWSVKHEWVRRCAAWETHISGIEADAKLKLVARKAAEAAEAQWEEGIQNRELAGRLRKMALEMLERVNFEGEVVESGGKKRVRNKTKWNLNMIAKFAEHASRIGQVGIGEMLAHLMQDDGFDPATATADELRAFLAKHGVKGTGPGDVV